MFELAIDYAENGMAAYSRLQEREFEWTRRGYSAVRHQAFVGTGYFDEIAQIVAGGTASTMALKGSTEEKQFTSDSPAVSTPQIAGHDTC
jgi:isocitrate lyase